MESNEPGQGPSDAGGNTTTDAVSAVSAVSVTDTRDYNTNPVTREDFPAGEVGGALYARWLTAAQPASEHTPTREEAREMFKANPGLWAVVTDQGNMTRDEA